MGEATKQQRRVKNFSPLVLVAVCCLSRNANGHEGSAILSWAAQSALTPNVDYLAASLTGEQLMEAFWFSPANAFLRYQHLPGSGPTYVYLAGLGLAATASYPHIIRATTLAPYRAIIPDWLGCGFSDRPATFGYAIDDHVQTIARLLDHLQIANCTVIGHSMGGSVAISLAAQRPDLVGRILLAEANLDAGGGAFSRSIAASTEDEFVQNGYDTLIQTAQTDGRTGNRVAAVAAGIWQVAAPHALYRSAVSLVQGVQPSWRDILYQLAIPRTYLFGEYSLPDDDSTILPAHGIQVVIVPQAGHGMMWENPTGFVATIAAMDAQ
jgi:pimeloyl-ACP methyl ester carboxylesterase